MELSAATELLIDKLNSFCLLDTSHLFRQTFKTVNPSILFTSYFSKV